MKTTLPFLLLFLLICNSGNSQVRSVLTKTKQVESSGIFGIKQAHQKISLGKTDVKKLLKEDSAEANSGLPLRIGTVKKVNLGLSNSGNWIKIDGGRVWKLSIHSPEAFHLNLIFSEFYIPEGGLLYIYNEEGTMVYGPLSSKQNSNKQRFSTDAIKGETITLELFEPDIVKEKTKLRVSKVVHGYKDIFNKTGGYGSSGSCNNNILCPEGNAWRREGYSVAMIMLADLTRICTGSLINNTNNDYTPYFLTAFHCMDVLNPNGTLEADEISRAENWVFRFHYKSITCVGGESSSYLSYSGSTYRSGWVESDFALVELDNSPSGAPGINYAGWDRSGNLPGNTTGIHHPLGDVMKISFDNQPPLSQGYYGEVGNNHWRVIWDDGTTEGGSSGSSLFDNNHRIIGQLRGGGASCTATDEPDWYGKFSASWNGGGADTTRLSNWLDPGGSGVTTLNGLTNCSGGGYFTGTVTTSTQGTFNYYTPAAITTGWATLNFNSPEAFSYTWQKIYGNGYVYPSSTGTTSAYVSPNQTLYISLTANTNICNPSNTIILIHYSSRSLASNVTNLFSVYPNHAKTNLTLGYEQIAYPEENPLGYAINNDKVNYEHEVFSFELYDDKQNLIFKRNKVAKTDFPINIDISNFSRGNYILHVFSNDYIESYHLLFE